MQPEMVEEVRAWFIKVSDDLRGAEIDLAATPPLLVDVVFHAQQAAEKAMKGFLTAHSRPFRKTHDLTALAEACTGIDPSLEEIVGRARYLTPYAWKFRYPGQVDPPALDAARDAFALARAVYKAILDRLPDEARP